MRRSNDPVDIIVEMMDNGLGGGMGQLAQASMTYMSGDDPHSGANVEVVEVEEEDDGHFSAADLKLAKRFIELVGSPDRARALIDKVNECTECLDLVDDSDESQENQNDFDVIGQISNAMPSHVDLPSANPMISNYNPGTPGSTY